ncbi:MAG: hypothetical protein MHM6MM_002615 [Cercozoa sp. M6MM]
MMELEPGSPAPVDPSSPEFIIGVSLCLTGNVCINLGTTLIKYSHGENFQNSVLRRCLNLRLAWAIGTALFVGGNLLNFASFSFAAQSLLSALSSVQFVSNVVFAGWFLGIPVTRRILFATALICCANVVVVYFGARLQQNYDVATLLLLFRKKTFLIYLSVTLSSALVLHTLYRRARSLRHRRACRQRGNSRRRRMSTATLYRLDAEAQTVAEVARMPNPSFTEVVTSSGVDDGPLKCWLAACCCFHGTRSRRVLRFVHKLRACVFCACSNSDNWCVWRCVDNLVVAPLLRFSHNSEGVLFALVSALLGTYSAMLAKSMSEMLRVAFFGTDDERDSQFTSPVPYLVLILWLFAMSFWLYRMNAAIKKFNVMFIVPTMQVFWIVFCVLSGGIYFREFWTFEKRQTIMFPIGLLLLLVGVMGLAPAVQQTPAAPTAEQPQEAAAVDDAFGLGFHQSETGEKKERSMSTSTPLLIAPQSNVSDAPPVLDSLRDANLLQQDLTEWLSRRTAALFEHLASSSDGDDTDDDIYDRTGSDACVVCDQYNSFGAIEEGIDETRSSCRTPIEFETEEDRSDDSREVRRQQQQQRQEHREQQQRGQQQEAPRYDERQQSRESPDVVVHVAARPDVDSTFKPNM